MLVIRLHVQKKEHERIQSWFETYSWQFGLLSISTLLSGSFDFCSKGYGSSVSVCIFKTICFYFSLDLLCYYLYAQCALNAQCRRVSRSIFLLDFKSLWSWKLWTWPLYVSKNISNWKSLSRKNLKNTYASIGVAWGISSPFLMKKAPNTNTNRTN